MQHDSKLLWSFNNGDCNVAIICFIHFLLVKMIIKERRGGRSFYVFYMNPADLLWYHRRWQAQTEDNKMKFAKSVSDGLHWYVKDGDMVKICMLISVCKIILVGWHVSAL